MQNGTIILRAGLPLLANKLQVEELEDYPNCYEIHTGWEESLSYEERRRLKDVIHLSAEQTIEVTLTVVENGRQNEDGY